MQIRAGKPDSFDGSTHLSIKSEDSVAQRAHGSGGKGTQAVRVCNRHRVGSSSMPPVRAVAHQRWMALIGRT